MEMFISIMLKSIAEGPLYIKKNIKRFAVFKKPFLSFYFDVKLLWSSESFEVKYNIGFGIPIEFPNQRRRKNYSNRSRNTEIGLLWSFGESKNFQVKIFFFIEIGQETIKLYLN